MKYALGVLLALFLVGALAWFYLGSQGATSTSTNNQPAAAGLAEDVNFKVLDQGTQAAQELSRKNYAIYTSAAFTDFWKEAHGEDGKPMPIVDFSKNYVIAVFAGSVASNGYSIAVSKIRDDGATRSVAVTIVEPGDECHVVEEPTSPYQFVQVPVSDAAAFTHTDVRTRTNCR